MGNYFEKIKKIVVDILQVDQKQVTIEASLRDLGADSLDISELLMEFEEHFGIEIPIEDTEKLVRLKDALDYITAKKAEKSAD
ncbi:MAG TPA: acyl carrier protein [Candidatus Riflebacteria bacterium]|nr:acyl carrier protein [Candidatus Riflebacteria bacterium]